MSTRTKSKSSNADLARAMAAIKADLGEVVQSRPCCRNWCDTGNGPTGSSELEGQ